MRCMEKRKVVIADIPGAFLSADWPNDVPPCYIHFDEIMIFQRITSILLPVVMILMLIMIHLLSLSLSLMTAAQVAMLLRPV